MLAETLHQYLQALPSREAEQALLAFRASAEAWDVCLGIVSASQGAVPDKLNLFAAQTLHTCARRFPVPKDGETAIADTTAPAVISRQQALGNALVHMAGQGGHQTTVLCAALAALSVRHPATVGNVLHAALQQLPQSLAVQLLVCMVEECEALQARAGSDVGRCSSANHVLREEVGQHVLTWLAQLATTPPHLQHPEQQHLGAGGGTAGNAEAGPLANQHLHLQPRLLSLVVRCVGAWSRLGCLYSACCPAGAVRQLLALMLGCVRPGSGAPASVRHDACEAMGDVIEHGPDALLRELHNPLVHLAAAAAAAANDDVRTPRQHGDADAVYDIVQLVSSYAAARLGELVAAACGTPPPPTASADADAAASADADAAALVGALCQLAALPGWTEGGYPVSWPAMQVLADLALGCIAAVPPPPPAAAPLAVGGRAGVGVAAGGGQAAGDAMQQDSGAGGGGGAAEPAAGVELPADEPPSAAAAAAAAPEHCVPDITLGPRPGLPQPLLVMYDNILRSVLSCCVAWSLLDAPDVGSEPPSAAAAAMDGGGGGGGGGEGGGGGVEAAGLLRLPPECDEALRGCLQACGGVVGQARQLETAVALLQHTAAATTHGSVAAAATAAAMEGWHAAAPPPPPPPSSAAALTAALAAVSACGALPAPAAAAAAAGDAAAENAAAAAATAASWILLAAAEHLRGRSGAAAAPAAPTGLAAPLTLHYCEALAGSCRAVLHLHRPNLNTLRQHQQQQAGWALRPLLPSPVGQAGGAGVDGGPGGDDRGGEVVLFRLAEAALAGLRTEVTAVAAARALRVLVTAARDLAAPLPVPMAAALVDSAHALPYDAGPSYQAAERELVRAAVAAAAAAGGAGAERLQLLLQRLLAPAVSLIGHTAAAAAAAPAAPSAPSPSPPPPAPPPPAPASGPPASRAVVSHHQDDALCRQLRLFEAALGCSSDPEPPAASAPSGGGAPEAAPAAAAAAAVFVQQAWPPLRALLQRGGSGRFLLPLCRCLASLLRRTAAAAAAAAACGGGSGGGCDAASSCAAMQQQQMMGASGAVASPEGGVDGPDPWVASVLEALAGCVGRPGAKHAYEPLVAMLEVCCASAPEAGLPERQQQLSGAGVSALLQRQQQQQQQQQAGWRQRHGALVARTLYDILHGRVASELAATWRAADRDPDTAGCLLRLATAAVRYGSTTSPYGGGSGSHMDPLPAAAAAAPGSTTGTAAAVAAAALRLAAASSGCDHRQVAAAALACTCAVLEEACGSWPAAAGGPNGGGAAAAAASGAGAAAGAAQQRRELLAVVVQSGPLVTSGLLAALLSSSPLPRLQRVATALVLLAAALAVCYELEQAQQAQQQLAVVGVGVPQGVSPAAAATAAAQAACGRVLGSWLAAAATYLQLPQQEGASLASSWASLLAEAGLGAAAVAACSAGSQAASSGSSSGSSGCQVGAATSAAARGLSRKLRRLLREFAESRLRA